MKNYDFSNMFNDVTKKAHTPITYLNINNLMPNNNNPYSIEDINELADSILELGLMQNLVVKKIKKDKYTIISGHRRYNALKKIVESGSKEYEEIPCIIIDEKEYDALTTIKLHESNLTSRDISPSEKLNALKELENSYKKLKKIGYKFKSDYKGKLDFLSQKTNLSLKQVQKYSTINNSNNKEVLEEIDNGELTIDEAYDKVKKPNKKQIKKDIKTKAFKQLEKLKEIVAPLENEDLNQLLDDIYEILDYE